MSDKNAPKLDPVKPGDFQLNFDDFKTGNFVIDNVIKGLIKFFNELDLNKDGHRDLVQFAPFILKAVPLLVQLAPLVHVDLLVEWFVGHDFIKDKDAARKAIAAVLEIVTDASKLIPKE